MNCKVFEGPGFSVLPLPIHSHSLLFVRSRLSHVPFGTWDGTERSEMRCSVPCLVERAVPWDEFWVNFRSASPPGTTCSTSVEHKIITSLSPSSSSLFPSEGIFAPSPFRLVLSRPIPFRPVLFAYQTIPPLLSFPFLYAKINFPQIVRDN
ncbi:hypothetical protein DVH24_003442 [Malus domestica]|uniref:Uncharacterized protein n=1 Tax=Malus domestica TaxID=3750 RepID=A0A498ILA4_MALDO|nr:hypothetical protein DVH24_003442 [Malus domestica]